MTAEPIAMPRPQVYWGLQKEFKARPSDPRDIVHVELLTDPFSVWCWGLEPVRRTLELRYPTIDFQPLVGGMFPRLPNPEELGFDVDRFFANVQRTTGMPIDPGIMRKDRPESTFPSCIHYHAARLVAPDRHVEYLRALREAVYLDGLNASRPSVAKDVAKKVGIDPDAWQSKMDSGEAKAAFDERVKTLEAQNLAAYPTFLLELHDGRTARVQGFQTLPGLLGIIEAVSGRLHSPLPDPPLDAVIRPGERVATREVAETLGVSVERAVDILDEAAEAGRLVHARRMTGDVWSRAETKT